MKAGWEVRPLGEVASVTGGGTPSKERADYWTGDILWVSPKDMKSPIINDTIDKITSDAVAGSATQIVPEGTLLIVVRSGILAHTIPTALAGRSVAINQDLKAIKVPKTIDRHFFAYFMRSAEPILLAGVTRGATVHRLASETLKNLPIPLPPLEEQRRIVAMLDEAFDSLARARANIEANMADAGELLNVALHQQTTSSEDAQPLRLESIVNRLTNGYVGPTRNIYHEEGVPYLLARHVRNNKLTFDGRTYITEAFNEKHKKSKLRADDVVLVQSGHIGHAAVIGDNHDGHNCHAMIVLTTKKDVITGKFLSAVFNTPRLQAAFQNIRTGSTVPHLTCKMVKELEIDVPPLEDQVGILERLEVIQGQHDSYRRAYTAQLADLATLRQTLLARAFRGELT